MRRFEDNPDNAPAKQAEYKAKLESMTDKELLTEGENKIWLSAYAANNPASCFHWHATYIYTEAERRGKPELYERAYTRARRLAGC
jgi:Mlc titration factor MtfA (ptsG expression regulator)